MSQPVDRAEVVARYEAGETMEEIGRSSNVSKARIHQIVKGVADYKKHYRSRRLTLVTAEIKRHMNYLDRDEQAVVLAALTTAYAADASG